MTYMAAIVATALAIPAGAQVGSRAEVFSGKDVTSQLAVLAQKAKASGGSGTTLTSYDSHVIGLSVRGASGGAELHADFDDIFVVTGGKATLVSGGTIVNAHAVSKDEIQGSSVRGGTSQTIGKGDIVNIPAGTPHQLVLAPGVTYSALVIKVREP